MGAVALLLVACGPTEEQKALKKERVELMAMQHAALTSGEKSCDAAQKRLDEFAAANKERLDKFNAAWDALDESKREKLLGIEPQSGEEVNNEIIKLIVSCPGIRRPVSSK